MKVCLRDSREKTGGVRLERHPFSCKLEGNICSYFWRHHGAFFLYPLEARI